MPKLSDINLKNAVEDFRRLNPALFGVSTETPIPTEKQQVDSEEPVSTKPHRGKKPNGTEQRMLDLCAAKKRCGEIHSYVFEGMRLKWGDDGEHPAMHYTADVVVTAGAKITLIEVKGAHIYDRDVVRFKGCRAEWPQFTFEMWQWADRQWTQIL